MILLHVQLKDKNYLSQLSPEKRGDTIQNAYAISDINIERIKPIYLLCPLILTVGHLHILLTSR